MKGEIISEEIPGTPENRTIFDLRIQYPNAPVDDGRPEPPPPPKPRKGGPVTP